MSGIQKPIRLPPLKTLRVKNPNAKPERACLAVMSSVLCKLHPPLDSIRFEATLGLTSSSFFLSLNDSMLGISGLYYSRMRPGRAGPTSMHGRTAAGSATQERGQLSLDAV